MNEWWADILKTVIGAGLGSGGITLWLNRSKKKADGTYLAMRLAIILEAYAEACSDLIGNNQNAPHPREDQYPNWETKLPVLPPYPEDDDGWKAIATDTASDCLNLHNRIFGSHSIIRDTIEHAEEDIERVVRAQACERGLEAWTLATQLRAAHGLRPITPVFDYPGHLERNQATVRAEETERERKGAEFWAKLEEKHLEDQNIFRG